MNSRISDYRATINLLAFVLVVCFPCLASGQVASESGTVALTVEGRVADVFRSASSESRYLVKILVQKSEATSIGVNQGATRFPAPGEYVYVGVEETTLNRRALNSPELPRPNMFIRATLSAGEHQEWVGDSSGWFRELNGTESASSSNVTRSVLGIEAEAINSRSVRGVKVTSVVPSTPAAKAGIEVGDVLVKVNGIELDSLARLDQQVARSKRSLQRSMKLTVRDVRTGRDVPVEVELEGDMSGRGPQRSLGVTTELAFYGGNPALKIVSVSEGSASQRAGLETGWLILSADGQPLDKPETLNQAERNADAEMVLKVFDPKTRKQRDVRVNLR